MGWTCVGRFRFCWLRFSLVALPQARRVLQAAVGAARLPKRVAAADRRRSMPPRARPAQPQPADQAFRVEQSLAAGPRWEAAASIPAAGVPPPAAGLPLAGPRPVQERRARAAHPASEERPAPAGPTLPRTSHRMSPRLMRVGQGERTQDQSAEAGEPWSAAAQASRASTA